MRLVSLTSGSALALAATMLAAPATAQQFPPPKSNPPANGQRQPAQRQPARQAPGLITQVKAETVAEVNGEAITKPEFDAAVQRQLRGQQVPPEAAGQVRKQILDGLIESRLVEQYVRKEGPDVEPQEVNAAVQRIEKQLAEQQLTLDRFLQARGYTEDSLKKRLEGSIAWQKFQQEQMTEPQLREFFEDNQDQFQQNEFDAARQEVANAYVAELWSDIVQQMRPKAKIEVSKSATGNPAAPKPNPNPNPNQPSTPRR